MRRRNNNLLGSGRRRQSSSRFKWFMKNLSRRMSRKNNGLKCIAAALILIAVIIAVGFIGPWGPKKAGDGLFGRRQTEHSAAAESGSVQADGSRELDAGERIPGDGS